MRFEVVKHRYKHETHYFYTCNLVRGYWIFKSETQLTRKVGNSIIEFSTFQSLDQVREAIKNYIQYDKYPKVIRTIKVK